MSETSKAVFLSYASQDAEAARRICETLRSGGVEVWFDADGGLEHGDEWDAKIRRQIKECVLFIPVISANTQAREEGYFRLEWDLAAERARNIATGVPFILPVVIDETREPDALVPDRFRAVQWTRLRGGEVPPEVKARLLKLWSHRTGALKHDSGVARAFEPVGSDDTGQETRATPKVGRRVPVAAWGVVTLAVVLSTVGYFWLKRSDPPTAPALSSSKSRPTATPISAAQQLVAKAWEALHSVPEPFRAQLEIAGDFCRRATELDSGEADAWAAWSHVESWYVAQNVDRSPARRESARAKAARAINLAPQSYEARLALACSLLRAEGFNNVTQFTPEAEKHLRELLQEKPDEPRALLALGHLLYGASRVDEGSVVFDRLARNPAWVATAYNGKGWMMFAAQRWDDASAAAERSVAARPFFGNLALQIQIAQRWSGDLEAAKTAVERMPAADLREDVGVSIAVLVYWWRREPGEMLRLLRAVPRDWFQSQALPGPKDFWIGTAQHMAGNGPAAELAWRAALRVVEQRLANDPNSGALHGQKAELLALLGERTAAQTAREIGQRLGGMPNTVRTRSVLRDWTRNLAGLERVNWAILRYSPEFDPLRNEPEFQASLAAADADPSRSPRAARAGARKSAGSTPEPKSIAVPADGKLE